MKLFGEFPQSVQKEKLLTSNGIFVHITSDFRSSAQNRPTKSLELSRDYNVAKIDKKISLRTSSTIHVLTKSL